MVFASTTFIFVFLPIFLLFYILCKQKNVVLCIFSLIFYGLGEPVYIFLMLLISYVNYFFGKKIGLLDIKNQYIRYEINTTYIKKRKIYLALAVVFDILVLIIFKYLNSITNFLLFYKKISFSTNIVLPIGISFYIFQSISYVVDVYRKDCEYQKSFFIVLIYISMFPQLIAGPIVRYKDIEVALTKRKVNVDNVFVGISRVTYGLAKKVIIANQLSIFLSELLFTSKMGNVIGIFVFMFQLYYDFSGYSDIAIGLGKILGFDFLENFNYPIWSLSLTNFWRKWHISLSTFFRDYVYIPLGGNRHNHYRNIFIVWFLTGIWHGATYNFVLWGLFLALFMFFEKIYLNKINMNIIFKILYMTIVLYMSFGIFYFDDISNLKKYINTMYTCEFLNYETYTVVLNNIFLAIVAIVCSIPMKSILKKTILKFRIFKSVYIKTFFIILNTAVIMGLLFVVTILLIGEMNNPFIYFRF